MNLRQKFIWNLVLAISVIILAWNSYFQFYQHNDVQRAYKKFKNEEVGTDKEYPDLSLRDAAVMREINAKDI